ncbi:HicB family protein [Tepidimonas sediminis]|uniref:HicB family protein n=1 Tax=Tepidimonas sediminis TaxID=2588941 RepID=A0A554WMQ0_9BURK|nr:toxin-antitoxin system HicB family antitoxin [Tepidimonas sediminis]TSE24847.1 HicB family protein [Tepidimonas sediminis]
MTALTVRLPTSLHQRIRELAARDGISVNQFIASAAAEKLASVLTLEYLRREASGATRTAFERYLQAVPDVEPALDTDRLPAPTAGRDPQP